MKEELKKLGFSEKEANIYLALVELGAAKAADLAKKAGENRTTTYSILSNLVRQGLVEIDVQGVITYYTAGKPDRLIEAIQEDLTQKVRLANQIAKQLNSTARKESSYLPKVKVFVGDSGIKNMFLQYYNAWVQDAIKNSEDKILWTYRKGQSSSLKWSDIFINNWKKHKYSQQGARVQVLAHQKGQLPGYSRFAKVKVLPAGYSFFDGVFWVCGDFVIMFYETEKPPFGVMIRDHTLAQTIRSLLQFAWDHV